MQPATNAHGLSTAIRRDGGRSATPCRSARARRESRARHGAYTFASSSPFSCVANAMASRWASRAPRSASDAAISAIVAPDRSAVRALALNGTSVPRTTSCGFRRANLRREADPVAALDHALGAISVAARTDAPGTDDAAAWPQRSTRHATGARRASARPAHPRRRPTPRPNQLLRRTYRTPRDDRTGGSRRRTARTRRERDCGCGDSLRRRAAAAKPSPQRSCGEADRDGRQRERPSRPRRAPQEPSGTLIEAGNSQREDGGTEFRSPRRRAGRPQASTARRSRLLPRLRQPRRARDDGTVRPHEAHDAARTDTRDDANPVAAARAGPQLPRRSNGDSGERRAGRT